MFKKYLTPPKRSFSYAKASKIYLLIIFLVIFGFVIYNNRIFIKDYFSNSKKTDLPQEVSKDETLSSRADLESFNNKQDNNVEAFHETPSGDDVYSNDNNQTPPNPRQQIKQEINLKIPFTIQSPDQKWQEPYEEGCEEASILMVYSYLNNKNITIDSAMKDIADMVDWQSDNLGGHFDLSASTTAYLANNFYNLSFEMIDLKSIDDIKKILSSGNPLILPTLGRELKNPNFKSPGPIYHMLVVKGYTKDGFFITNDPGTRKGKDYLYNFSVLFNAIGDFDYVSKSPNANKKVGIILK